MNWQGILQFFLYIGLVIGLAQFFGTYMYKVFTYQRTFLDRILLPVERLIHRACGVNPKNEQHWSAYALNTLALGIGSIIIVFIILKLQKYLPLNPQEISSVSTPTAINSAVAFATNTDWQPYSVEKTLSYFSITMVLTVQCFISPAICMAVAIALMRGITRENSKTIGNFWGDITRAILWILLPIALVTLPILVWQGVPQNFGGFVQATTLEGAKQTIAQGPVASFTAISILGSNGGGIFSVNAAHPYANPTYLTNFVYLVFMLLIGISLLNVFGMMTGERSQGGVLVISVVILFVISLFLTYYFESRTNPLFSNAMLDESSTAENIGGNMEGKEVRLGIAGSSLWAVATTATDNGSANAAHDSFSPLGGLVVVSNMLMGSLVGGAGAAFYTLIVYVILTVFIVCLMVGTAPEYMGKKIEVPEIKLVMFALLLLPTLIMVLSSIAIIAGAGPKSVTNPGPHGLTQIIYNYTSVSANNGSSFGGFDGSTLFHNIVMPLGMFIGKFVTMAIILALAGALAEKKKTVKTGEYFRTNTSIFAVLLVIIILVSGMVFMPAMALGPLAEHIMIMHGKMY